MTKKGKERFWDEKEGKRARRGGFVRGVAVAGGGDDMGVVV